MNIKDTILQMQANSNQEPRIIDDFELQQKEDEKKRIEVNLNGILDAKYKDITFDDFSILPENQKTIDNIKSWLDNYKHGKWLVIKGNQGTGKTMLKNIIMRELYLRYKIKSYNTTLYTLYIDYLDALRDGKTGSMLDSLGNSKMLIIDEIGRRQSTEALKDFIFEVMDRLYLNGGSAILITNDKTVTGYIDESRLKEVGISLALIGKDWRV